MTFLIQREFTFEAAHRLTLHEGKCFNLHGHSYRVCISVASGAAQEVDLRTGMLLDTGVLKEVAAPVIQEFDHSVILNERDPIIDALMSFRQNERTLRIHAWPHEPTAEVLAAEIAGRVNAGLLGHPKGRSVKAYVHKVCIAETCSSAIIHRPVMPPWCGE